MSWLSSVTGIHVSPKGVKIEPLKALGTVATLGTLGAAGPLAGVLGGVGGALKAIPGVAAVGGALKAIPGVSAIGNAVSHIPGASAAGDFLKAHGKDILTGAQGIQALQKQQDADRMRKQALGILGNETLPDLSGIYATNGAPNPYAKTRGVTPVGGY